MHAIAYIYEMQAPTGTRNTVAAISGMALWFITVNVNGQRVPWDQDFTG